MLQGYNGTTFLQNFGNTLLLLLSVKIGYGNNKKKQRNYSYFMPQVHGIWRLGLEGTGSTQRSKLMGALSQHTCLCSPQ